MVYGSFSLDLYICGFFPEEYYHSGTVEVYTPKLLNVCKSDPAIQEFNS